MITIGKLIREQLENIVSLYHGTDNAARLQNDRRGLFFSTDKEFALGYGSLLFECKVNLGKVFDSGNKAHIELVYKAGFRLHDNYIKDTHKEGDEIFNYYDYEKDEYPTAESYIGNPYFDTNSWEAIEGTKGLINWILQNGFDSILLHEEGIINFYTTADRVVAKKLIRGKMALSENPDTINLLDRKRTMKWNDKLAYPFMYDTKGRFYIGDENSWHGQTKDYDTGERITSNSQGHREYMAGRAFGSDKILSFWFFPTPAELNKVIRDFNQLAKKKKLPFLIDSTWYIEVPKGDTDMSTLDNVSSYKKPDTYFDGWNELLVAKLKKDWGDDPYFSTKDF